MTLTRFFFLKWFALVFGIQFTSPTDLSIECGILWMFALLLAAYTHHTDSYIYIKYLPLYRRIVLLTLRCTHSLYSPHTNTMMMKRVCGTQASKTVRLRCASNEHREIHLSVSVAKQKCTCTSSICAVQCSLLLHMDGKRAIQTVATIHF